MLSHKKKLSERNKAETGIRYEWYALQRWAADYYEDFEKEKIVYSEIVQTPKFFYDEANRYTEATAFILTGKNLKFLISLFNSQFTSYSFKKFYAGAGLGETGFRFKKQFFENIPIPQITEEAQKPFIALVEQIMERKENNQDSTALENQIDQMVYELYNLTEEEIKMIEKNIK